MDPEFIGTEEWNDVSNLFPILWAFVGSIMVLAFSMLIGHAIIPSLVESGHLPERALKLRRAFYAGALAAFIVVAVIIGLANEFARSLANIWDRWWI